MLAGYGTSLVINGGPEGHLVRMGAASYEPATHTYERYVRGRFVPADPPGRKPTCNASALQLAVFTQVVRFNQVRCAAGWALAVGDGAGFTGPIVGLFQWTGREWASVSLDNGNLLPAAPVVYHLPLTLLARLATGAALAPQLAAARLIATMESQRKDFGWPAETSMVEAGGERWLIAVVSAGPPPKDYGPSPVGADIYRWDGTQWVIDRRIAHLSEDLNADYESGWFTFVPAAQPSAVAFRWVDHDHSKSRRVITNAGGSWHESGDGGN